jgi:hypothetical protein
MTARIETVIDNFDKLQQANNYFRTTDVLVGVPAQKAVRTYAEAKAKGLKINNAALGYIHNYGLPTKNIPARPFMEPGIHNSQAQVVKFLRAAAEQAIEGNPGGVRKNFIAAGIAAQTAIKAKINTGPFAPLKESTLAARRRRGRTGTRPLIDTAQLRNSINFVVRMR